MAAVARDLPCVIDRRQYDREWVRGNITVAEQRYMVGLCDGCPGRMQCFLAALDLGEDANGVWGGLMWRKGRSSNPREDCPTPKSTVAGVHWEHKRGEWKAYGHTPRVEGKRRFVHIGYFEKEDDAIEAVRKWRESQGQALPTP